MASQIVALAILVLTCAIGIWKFVARVKSEKRLLADKAKEQLEKSNETNNPSDLLDSFDSINRASRLR